MTGGVPHDARWALHDRGARRRRGGVGRMTGIGRRAAGWCAPRRCGFYRVIPRVVAESRGPGLKVFYGHYWGNPPEK